MSDQAEPPGTEVLNALEEHVASARLDTVIRTAFVAGLEHARAGYEALGDAVQASDLSPADQTLVANLYATVACEREQAVIEAASKPPHTIQ